MENAGLNKFVTVAADPDGEGDATYPGHRQIHILYTSVLPQEVKTYLRDEVLLEAGARSLFEPTATASVDSFVATEIRHHREIFTSVRDVDYTPDIRKRICLVPSEEVLEEWKNDY